MTTKSLVSSSKAVICCFLFVFFCLAKYSEGHAYFSSIAIDGVAHTEGDCIRPHPSSKYDYPISELGRTNGLTSADMTCGWLPNAAKAANKKCAVNPGSTITMQWHYEMGLGSSDTFIIDPSHKGPCIVYMAKSETGAGAVWFKIFEDGYDQTTKKWCVDKLRANKGQFTATIPTDITPGNYLFRVELIALHEGDQLYGAQPYVGCAELSVGGSGKVNPGNLVAFPGAYTARDPGILFDIYTGKNPKYPIPGPALYVSGSSSGTPSPPPAVTTAAKPATTGTKPATTGVKAATTGKQTQPATTGSKVQPQTTGKIQPQQVTTGKIQPATTGRAQSSGSSAMCYLPNTPNLNGRVSDVCGRKGPRNRCGDGQCCSQWGYCGPVPDRNGNYREYVDGRLIYVSQAFAFDLYCNKTSGDYRKVPCDSIQPGSNNNNNDNNYFDNKEIGAANTILNINYLMVVMAILFALLW